MSFFNFGLRPAHLQLRKLAAFLHQYLGNVTTLPDGTRQLVDSGSAKNNATLYSGQGMHFNGVDQYIFTNISRNHYWGKEFTVTTSFDLASTSVDQYIFGSSWGANVFGVRVKNNTLEVLLGTLRYSCEIADGFHVLTISANGVDTASLYLNGNLVSSFFYDDTEMDTVYSHICLGGLRIANSTTNIKSKFTGIIKDFYFIPQALTAEEISAHYQNPEKTLYWENGVLKSDFLPQSTIDAMQAGNGFWYPLSENTSAGGYVRNHALPMPVKTNDINFAGFAFDTTGVGADSIVITSDISASTTIDRPVIFEVDVAALTGTAQWRVAFSDATTTTVDLSLGLNRLNITPPAGQQLSSLAINAQTDSTGSINKVDYYDRAGSGLTQITNYTDTMRTNAQQLPYGYQMALTEQDEFGLPISPPDGLLHWDGKSYADLGNQVISGDFVLHFVGYNNPDKYAGVMVYTDKAYVAYGTDNSWVRAYLYEIAVWTTTPAFVVSYLVNATTKEVRAYTNGVYGSAKIVADTELTLYKIGCRLVNQLHSEENTGTLQIQQGVFTDEQVAAQAQELMAKHGITV